MRSVKVGEIHYRIICAHYGQECHSSHVWQLKTKVLADEAVGRYDKMPGHPGCAPWTVQAQAVTEWGDPDATELCLYAMGQTLSLKS